MSYSVGSNQLQQMQGQFPVPIGSNFVVEFDRMKKELLQEVGDKFVKVGETNKAEIIRECRTHISALETKFNDQMSELKELLVCLKSDANIWTFTFPVYEAKADARSPVDFLREFEKNLKPGTTDEEKAKALRYVLSKGSATSWVSLMDDSSPYDAVKHEFLRRHWDPKTQKEVIVDFLTYDLRKHQVNNFHDYFLLWKKKLLAAIKNEAIVPALINIFRHNAPSAVRSKFDQEQPKDFDDIDFIIAKMQHNDLMYNASYPQLRDTQTVYSELFKETFIL